MHKRAAKRVEMKNLIEVHSSIRFLRSLWKKNENCTNL